jgi:AraC-like DNA-binding protein
MHKMADLVRSACLTNYAEVARSVGIEPIKMLRKVGLPRACLGDQDMRIPVSGVRRLLEASATAAGVDEFGLLMAERGGLSHLGPVALIVREQATVGLAIEALSRYVHIHNEAIRLSVERQDDVVIMALFLRGRRPRAPRQAAEMTLGTLHRVISSLFRGDWRPLEVHLTRSPPRNLKFYRLFFGCNVIFDSDFDGIVCPAIDMDRPIPTADPLMARYVQSRVEAIDIRSENWSDKVSELVRSLLPNGQCTMERVAEHLGCNRRTVHRHLFENGTSFSEILDAQRADLATRLIEDSNRPLAGIAELLGFSAQSAMARWFRGRFGCSLTQWRNGIRPKALTSASTRGVASKRQSGNKLKRPSLRSRRLARLGN